MFGEDSGGKGSDRGGCQVSFVFLETFSFLFLPVSKACPGILGFLMYRSDGADGLGHYHTVVK